MYVVGCDCVYTHYSKCVHSKGMVIYFFEGEWDLGSFKGFLSG